MRPTRSLFLAFYAAALAASLSPVHAEVFVANSSNGRITRFDAAGTATTFPGNTSSLVTPLGIALDAAGRLIVCDNQRGRIVRYDANGAGPTVLASQVSRPDGPSFSEDGDLFFVTSPDGSNSSKMKDVYVLAGGSGLPVKIGPIPESLLLRDTAVVPTGPYSGQLLVLSSKPAFIARFSKTSPTTWARQANFVSSVSGEPTGMAFTTSGDLLVSGIEGVVRRFDQSGGALSDFASGLGNGATRIAAGSDGIVYVTNRNRPSLYRFDLNGTRLADFGGSLQSPAGVTTPELTPTPTGRNVTVSPIPGVVLSYDQVVESGFTSALRTFLEPGQRTTPCGNVIPEFVGLPAGDDRFQVIRIETTAFFTDTIFNELSHPDGNSRAFHAPCPPESEVAFEDVTVLAVPGDPRANIPKFSEFVIGTDLRPNATVIQIKLAALQATVAPGSPGALSLGDATLEAIRTRIRNVAALIGANDFAGAIEALQSLKAFVREGSGTTIPNIASAPGGNLAGALISSSLTLIFSLGLNL